MSRFNYVKYDEQAQSDQDVLKAMVENLADNIIVRLRPGRASSLAITKLEEVYMWIGKGIRDDQIARNGDAPLMEERKNG